MSVKVFAQRWDNGCNPHPTRHWRRKASPGKEVLDEFVEELTSFDEFLNKRTLVAKIVEQATRERIRFQARLCVISRASGQIPRIEVYNSRMNVGSFGQLRLHMKILDGPTGLQVGDRISR